MLSEKEYWFWLCNINGIGYKKITDLIRYYESPKEVFSAKEEQLEQIPSLTKKDKAYLAMSHKDNEIKECYEKMEKQNVKFYIPEDLEYPERLRHIFDPPYGIYVKGRLPDENKKSVAIIGARNCTNYGKELALYFSKYLVKHNIQIISGLAMGIDSYGHWGAIEEGGYTLGVLGCGINRCYPESNRILYNRMSLEGGLLSEYGFMVLPRAGNFPRRNRLISGMCDGILVVEARQKSGSFITVDQGLEQGKDIFAIPGRITDELSVGCNRLVTMGAVITCHPDDILQHLNQNYQGNHSKTLILSKTDSDSLNLQEQQVLTHLSLQPVSLSELMELCNLDSSILMESILHLQLLGMIKELTRYHYVRMLND